MSEIIDKALTTLHENVMEMPNRVLEIFNNFYGEERVDMQGFITKSRLKYRLEGMTVYQLFSRAGMEDELPLVGLNRNEEIVDLELDSLPEESIKKMAEAISSDQLYTYIKNNTSGGFLLVHFPSVTVTNEYNKSTVVKHLYVKVPISIDGSENGVFTMNRSEYTLAELRSGYMHSHASNIPTHDFTKFTHCCLGSGPLGNTQTSLGVTFDEDRWNIFCLELSKYVEVESIAGVPYHKLEQISLNTSKVANTGRVTEHPNLYLPYPSGENMKELIRDFLRYYIENNDLTFSFRNGVYSIGMPFIDYLIKISNSFIEWINKTPKYQDIIYRANYNRIISGYTVRNGVLYENSNDLSSLIERCRPYVGKEICTFKGRTITVNITDIDRQGGDDEHQANLLLPSFASYVLNRILTTLNYRYGRNQEDSLTSAGKIKHKI